MNGLQRAYWTFKYFKIIERIHTVLKKNILNALNNRADTFWQLGTDKIMFCKMSQKYWGKSWHPSPGAGAKHRTPVICAQGFY